MVLVLNGPIWFRGIESLFVFIAGLVTILIALLSYKAYSLTRQQKFKYFSLSFFSLSLSFFLLSVVSSLLVTHVFDNLTLVLSRFDFVFLLHMLLSLIAYTLLLILTLKIKDRKVQVLMISLVVLLALFSYQHFLKFHIISLVLLFLLSYQFYSNYLEKKNLNAKLVFASFYLLTAAEAFIILHLYSTDIFYLVGRVVQFMGYLGLFYAFLRVVNNGGKKRKA